MNNDDKRLIAETLKGRSAAFGELIVRYQDRLFNAVIRVVDNHDDALDIVQDSFVNAFQGLTSFKGDSEFYTWLYRIAFNASVSQARRRKPLVPLQTGPDGSIIGEPIDTSEVARPDAALERSEEEETLQNALNRLSSEHRSILVLKDIDGMKYEEIAEVLQVPIGTVRSRIHRARLELRDLLTENE